jgi:hypothetical protein
MKINTTLRIGQTITVCLISKGGIITSFDFGKIESIQEYTMPEESYTLICVSGLKKYKNINGEASALVPLKDVIPFFFSIGTMIPMGMN